jgi:molybdopterin converting factor small subunit
MITIHLPASLAAEAGADTLTIAEPVRTIAELIEVLDRRLPSFRVLFDDAMVNFAVNDGMLLHGVRGRTLEDGDVVELIPTISGG